MSKSRVTKTNWRSTDVSSTDIEVLPCETVLPINTDNNRSPLVFNIRSVNGLVTDTKNIRLKFKYKLEKLSPANKDTMATWENVKQADYVVPYTGTGFSLFEDVHVYLNGILTETSQREYARSSYIKSTVFSTEDEQHELESAQLYIDRPGLINTVALDVSKNKGEYLRADSTWDGKEVEVYTPVMSDLLQTDGYFPDNVSISIRLYPAKSECCVVARNPVQYKITITDATLYVPRCKLSTPVPKNIEYETEFYKMLTYTHPSSSTHFSKMLDTSAKLPKKIAVMLIKEKQFNGNYSDSGFHFKHLNVSNITVQSNGHSFPNSSGLCPDFKARQYSDVYEALFSKLHAKNINFDYNTFDQGYTIFGFNLTPSGISDDEKKSRQGSCVLDITFGKAPDENVVVLILLIYDARFRFDSRGNFSSDVPKLQ